MKHAARTVARWVAVAGLLCAASACSSGSGAKSPPTSPQSLCGGWFTESQVRDLLPPGNTAKLKDVGGQNDQVPGLPAGCTVVTATDPTQTTWYLDFLTGVASPNEDRMVNWRGSADRSVPALFEPLGHGLTGYADEHEAVVFVPPCHATNKTWAARLQLTNLTGDPGAVARPDNRGRLAAAVVSAVNIRRRADKCEGPDLPAPAQGADPVRGDVRADDPMCGFAGVRWKDVLPAMAAEQAPLGQASIDTGSGYSGCGLGVHVGVEHRPGRGNWVDWGLEIRSVQGDPQPPEAAVGPAPGDAAVPGYRGTAWQSATDAGTDFTLRTTCHGRPLFVVVKQNIPRQAWLPDADETFRRITDAVAKAKGCESFRS